MTESLFDNPVQPSQIASYQYYEQPLTERMRTFLRLDFLFQQAHYFISRPSKMDSRVAITTLINLLELLNHGDIGKGALKDLDKFTSQMKGYLTYPNVDKHTLHQQLVELNEIRSKLIEAGLNLGSDLRENDFMNLIKHRSAIPGGACNFDIPTYAHWLRQSYEKRASDLETWFHTITPLHKAIQKILWLTRESSEYEDCVAKNGLFQKQLSKSSNMRLIRVGLPLGVSYYPEISGSQHRFSVRFYQIEDINIRPKQTEADINFRLFCC